MPLEVLITFFVTGKKHSILGNSFDIKVKNIRILETEYKETMLKTLGYGGPGLFTGTICF